MDIPPGCFEGPVGGLKCRVGLMVPLRMSETMDKILHLSKPQTSRVKSSDDSRTHLSGLA